MKTNPENGLTSTETCRAMNKVYDLLRSLTPAELDRFEDLIDVRPNWLGHAILKYQVVYIRARWGNG